MKTRASYRRAPFSFKCVPMDCCIKCRIKLEEKQFKIVFKDVVECTNCGHIWVALSHSILLSYV